MYLIDTAVIIWVLRGNRKYVELLLNLKNNGPLCISTITIAEIYKNIFPSELLKTENVLSEFQIYDVDSAVAKQAGLYWQEFNRRLKNLSLTDCLIASTANIYNITLVSLNVKHFPMIDIQV